MIRKRGFFVNTSASVLSLVILNLLSGHRLVIHVSITCWSWSFLAATLAPRKYRSHAAIQESFMPANIRVFSFFRWQYRVGESRSSNCCGETSLRKAETFTNPARSLQWRYSGLFRNKKQKPNKKNKTKKLFSSDSYWRSWLTS